MDEEFRKRAPLITIPFVLALPPLVGGWMGMKFDQYFETAHYGMYGMLILGFIAGVKETYRIIMKFGNNNG